MDAEMVWTQKQDPKLEAGEGVVEDPRLSGSTLTGKPQRAFQLHASTCQSRLRKSRQVEMDISYCLK